MAAVSACGSSSASLDGASSEEKTDQDGIGANHIVFAASGIVDPNPSSYLYAPSVMFNERLGLYQLWACGGVDGDYIIYKEATQLESLKDAPWQYALMPLHDGAFDHTHTCDPSVIDLGDRMVLYYGGLNETQAPDVQTTRLGVAVSYDGGRHFQRLNGGQPIIDLAQGAFTPGSYGVGQPAVARGSDGRFYMMYTHLDGTNAWLRVIRSFDPYFASYERVRDIDFAEVGGFSVDMAFNPSRNEFVVVEDGAVPGHGAYVRMAHYDLAFNLTDVTDFDADAGFRFGEGIGLLTNAEREIGRGFRGGQHEITFVAATFGSRGSTPEWIVGPMTYATYVEDSEGVVPNFDVSGFGIGVYNPFGSDGNFYIFRGEGSGFFSDQTAWHWGVFPTGKVFTGDFDGDGNWDVGLYNPNNQGNFFIQYGDGHGGFGRQTAWHWGVFPSAQVFSGDFNGDGKWDVGLYNPNNQGNFFIQYGDGHGGFGAQTGWHWGVFPTGKVFAGDFNGDGKWDVGLYNPNNQGYFYIQYGDGGGAFGGQTSWPWGVFPGSQVVSGDFDGDGIWDVALTNPLGDGRIFFQRGTGDGHFYDQKVFSWVQTGQFFTFKR